METEWDTSETHSASETGDELWTLVPSFPPFLTHKNFSGPKFSFPLMLQV